MPKPLEFLEEAFFSSYLINQSPDAVFCLDADARFLYLNNAACNRLEYSRQELLSMSLLEIDPDFSQKTWSEQWHSFKQQNSLVVQSQYRTKSGKLLPVEVTFTYVKDRDRDFSCVFIRTVEETKPSQELSDARRVYGSRNPLGLRLLKAEPSSEVSSTKETSEPNPMNGVKRRQLRQMQSGIPEDTTSASSFRADLSDGQNADPSNSNGSINNLYQEISQLKETEAQLAKNLSLVRGTLDSTAYGTIAISYQEEVLSYNQKFLEMWNIPDSLVLSKSEECQNFFARQLKNPNVFHSSVWEISRKSKAKTYDILELKDGRVFAQYSQPQRLEDEIIGRVWSVVDITELKQRTEIEIQKNKGKIETFQTIEKAKELSELRSRFLSMICHQFRSSLNIISFSNSILKRYVNKWSDDKKLPYLDNIQTAVEQIAELLDELVFFGKSEVGQIEFEPKPIDLACFCRTVITKVQPLSDGKQQTIEFIDRGDCEVVYADKNILHHILTNLLSNAIKYSPNGSKIQFEVFCDAKQAFIKIKDRGIGISAIDQPRLYTPFFRGSNANNIPGHGLGLSIVNNLVEIHGGEIEVESEIGIGTTFSLTLEVESSAGCGAEEE